MAAAFDPEQRRTIAGRARTLHERLADPAAVEPSDRDGSAVEEVFEEWHDQFPDDEAFDRRLDHDGWTAADCRRAIAAGRLAADEPIPAWVDRLDDLVTAVLDAGPGDQFRRRVLQAAGDGDGEEPQAFGAVSAAVASYARDQLPDDPVCDVLSDEAVESMVAWFRTRFEHRFTRILYVEFKTFVAAHDRELAFADPAAFDEPPTGYYEAFHDYLFSRGLVEICVAYPVFARLLVTQVRQFEEHLVEFARRLDADRAALAERFGDGDDLGAVSDVEPLADDTHGDGRAIMRVTFESGVTVAYKPRSVDAGEAFHGVVGRLNDHLPLPDLLVPAYLARDGYGWMEWLEPAECPDAAAVERYYPRAGALTCIAYLLEFSDCQIENLLVAGEHPVLVDGDTVLHPFFESDRRPSRTDAGALVQDSVLLTMLLPYGIEETLGRGGTEIQRALSGFGLSADEFELEGLEIPRVRAAGTDLMTVEYEPIRVDRSGNVPSVDGTPHPPDEYAPAIVDGFETAYETVLDLRGTGQLSAVGLPDALASIENRVVYRATRQYGVIIHSLTSRDCLADGARFGVEMETLAVPFCDGTVAEPRPWGLYDAERWALRRLDPPRFACRTEGTAIRLGDLATDEDADRSGMARATDRIAAASRADMRTQVELIRNAFGRFPSPRLAAGSTVRESVSREGWERGEPAQDEAFGREPATDGVLRREATALFDHVRESALETADGGLHWASIQAVLGEDGPEPLTVQLAAGSLYAGRPGIALFGAALHRVTGDSRYREFTLTALDPLRESMQADRDVPALDSLGGTAGIGGLVYGLAAVGDLLDDGDLLAEAARTAGTVTDDLVADDETYDVIGGSAGTILGLLAVHDRHHDRELVSVATTCGDRLLEGRVEVGGVRTWRSRPDARPLTGFSHGTSGISYALLRLHDATGDDRYRDAALDALAYEDAAYDDAADNWRDYREWTRPCQDQWCHGRSGIGLARLGMAAFCDDERVTRGIERAVDAFPGSGLGELDHLCCGAAGRSSFLLETERRLGRRTGEARELLGGVLARKRATGSYRTMAYAEQLPSLALFDGLAGIGYAMLRVTEPELPCVLLWE